MTARAAGASAYRSWLKLCVEFPELRWDLDAKWDYFILWRIARDGM